MCTLLLQEDFAVVGLLKQSFQPDIWHEHANDWSFFIQFFECNSIRHGCCAPLFNARLKVIGILSSRTGDKFPFSHLPFQAKYDLALFASD